MNKQLGELHVIRLRDTHDCETCGWSIADGYTIVKDGVPVLTRKPHAHCYDGDDYNDTDLLKDICELFNYNFTEETE